VRQSHEYLREGTMKILTLFNPATGQVRIQPASQSSNTVLHAWLKAELLAILAMLPPLATPLLDPTANRALWQAWQHDLTIRFTLPEILPPLRLLLVWDNLAGHKTAELVVWLCQHGIMPLYTPLGGSWLNMAESIQRILKRRALGGQHPQTPEQIGEWFGQTANAWNRHPTPFIWHGKRWQRRRSRTGDRRHRVGGSAAYANRPVPRRRP
jgi:transposase